MESPPAAVASVTGSGPLPASRNVRFRTRFQGWMCILLQYRTKPLPTSYVRTDADLYSLRLLEVLRITVSLVSALAVVANANVRWKMHE